MPNPKVSATFDQISTARLFLTTQNVLRFHTGKSSRSVKKETDKASVGQSEDASSTGAQGAEVAAEAAAEAGVWVKTEAGSEGGDDQSSSSSAVCMDVVEEG